MAQTASGMVRYRGLCSACVCTTVGRQSVTVSQERTFLILSDTQCSTDITLIEGEDRKASKNNVLVIPSGATDYR